MTIRVLGRRSINERPAGRPAARWAAPEPVG
jgi:hypothetical protein